MLGAAMPRVNLAFFSLAGASLRLGALAATLRIALVVVTVRALAIAAGAYAGCWASGAAPQQRRFLWQSMVTQVRPPPPCVRVRARDTCRTWVQISVWCSPAVLRCAVVRAPVTASPPRLHQLPPGLRVKRLEKGALQTPDSGCSWHASVVSDAV